MDEKIMKTLLFFDKLMNPESLIDDGHATNLIGMSFINGGFLYSNKPPCFDVFNPSTGKVIGFCSPTNEMFIEDSFESAKKSQFRWQYFVSSQEKRRVFEEWWQMLDLYKEKLAALFTYESGKIYRNSLADIVESIDTIKAAYTTLHDEEGTIEPAQMPNKLAGTMAWPYKVVLAIKPWNFIAIYFWKVAASVMAGSAVILKEAEQIPFSAMCMTALFYRSLENILGENRTKTLGGLVQLLQGPGETVGRYAVNHGSLENRSYDLLTATGSWQMGSEVAQVSAKKITPQHLELSGVNRILQWYDYPLKKATREISLAAFGDAGQRCVSAETAFIPALHFGSTLSLVVEEAKKLRIGNPLDPTVDLGPIISKEQLEMIDRSIKEAVNRGLKPVLGGYPLNPNSIEIALVDGFNFNPDDFRKDGELSEGYWYVPTIFKEVPFYDPIMKYEVFGPVTIINELKWSHYNRLNSPEYKPEKDFWIEEYIKELNLEDLPNIREFLWGIALMNDNLFGLSCSFLSYDARYIFHFRNLAEYGLRYIGRGTTGAEVDDRTIFGGGKNSGYGREGGSVKYARSQAQFYIDFDQKTRLAQRD